MAEEKVEFSIETPVLGIGEMGSEVPSVRLHKADIEEAKEIEAAIRKHAGQETLNVIRAKAVEKRKSHIQKAFDTLHRAYARLHNDVDKSREDDVRRTAASKIVKLGSDPSKLTDAEYEKYLVEREKDQQLAAYIQKRDREGKL